MAVPAAKSWPPARDPRSAQQHFSRECPVHKILALRDYAAFCNEPWGLAIRKPTSKAQQATVAGLGIPDTHLHLYSRKGPPDHELALNVHAKEGENAINESENHLWLKLLH